MRTVHNGIITIYSTNDLGITCMNEINERPLGAVLSLLGYICGQAKDDPNRTVLVLLLYILLHHKLACLLIKMDGMWGKDLLQIVGRMVVSLKQEDKR